MEMKRIKRSSERFNEWAGKKSAYIIFSLDEFCVEIKLCGSGWLIILDEFYGWFCRCYFFSAKSHVLLQFSSQ